MLYHAEKSGQKHILLKLDVAKAFDMLEWEFLLSLLHKIGFGPNFICFIKATQASATSAI
jgi:hypothetical protein